MTKPVKVIVAPAFDDRGWDFQQAHIAFYHIAEKSTNLFSATEENPTYQESTEIDSLCYSANFWGSQNIKARGKKSKPLFVLDDQKELVMVDTKVLIVDEHNKPILDDEGCEQYKIEKKPIDVFTVDMSKPQYQQMMQTSGDKIDILGRIIERHYREEVAR